MNEIRPAPFAMIAVGHLLFAIGAYGMGGLAALLMFEGVTFMAFGFVRSLTSSSAQP